MGNLDYKQSGVDVTAGEDAVKELNRWLGKLTTKNVVSDLGVFGGFYNLDLEKWKKPILVSSTDGVGTKLIVARMANQFSSVGEDIVNHCVDDIFVHAAHPQFFMDYIGIGKMDPAKIEQIISGMSKACCENGMSLIGGEMAEMPDVYSADDFDLVGTIVGLVEKDQIINGETIVEGDVVIGLPSTGLHTNGYTLARKLFFDILNLKYDSIIPEMNITVADALLAVHKSYYPILKNYAKPDFIHGMAHITGGGIKGNLKRIMPENLVAVIEDNTWETPTLFRLMQEAGKINNESMFEAFNMGIGFIIVTDELNAGKILRSTESYKLGYIEERKQDERVEILF